MTGRLSPLPRPVAPAASVAQCGDEFKGLMALLAGCELALVDLGIGPVDAQPRCQEPEYGKGETGVGDGAARF